MIRETEIAPLAQNVVSKVWGVEYWMCNEELYCLKYLKVNPGFQCSIHAHAEKDETFIVCSGTLQLNVHYGDGSVRDVYMLYPGSRCHIRPETFHSFQAIDGVAWVTEVSTRHSDDDVTRLQSSRKLASE